MKQEQSASVMIVSTTDKALGFFQKILPKDQFYPLTWVHSAGEAQRELVNKSVDIVVINAPLKDEMGTELAIVFNGEIQETYPPQINTVYAIYLASELPKAVSPSLELDADALAALRVPPVMVVVSNEQSIAAQKGTSDWIFTDEKGKAVNVVSDGVHPENAKKTMPRIDILPSYSSYSDPLDAYLGFNVKGMDPIVQVPADEISIFCWKEEDWGKSGATGEEIFLNPVNGTLFFDLKDGNYVYEVTATWKKNVSFKGTASYTF